MIRCVLLNTIALVFGVAHCIAQMEYPVTIIPYDENLFDTVNLKMRVLPSLGPYFAVGNVLLAATENSEMLTMSFPEDVFIDDIFWNENDFIVKSDNRVYMFSEIQRPLLELEDSDFSIFPCDEKNIYIARPKEGGCGLYKLNLKLKKAKRMVNLRGSIVNVARRDRCTWVTTDAGIFKFDKDSCHTVLRSPSPIKAATMSRLGLFYATDSSVNFLISYSTYVTLLNTACKAISCDEHNLYLINEKNDLIQINLHLIELSLNILDAVSME